MAEFLNQSVEPEMEGFNAMGRPIPTHRKEAAFDLCKEFGLTQARTVECASAMIWALEHDKPYEAMEAGMKFVDLTGTYRLMAVLLTG